MTLDDAFNLVAEYHDADAIHINKQWTLQEQSLLDILKHATAEMFELSTAQAENQAVDSCDSSNQLEELADTLSCLFHFAIVHNFSIDEVAKTVKRKLELRFTKG